MDPPTDNAVRVDRVLCRVKLKPCYTWQATPARTRNASIDWKIFSARFKSRLADRRIASLIYRTKPKAEEVNCEVSALRRSRRAAAAAAANSSDNSSARRRRALCYYFFLRSNG